MRTVTESYSRVWPSQLDCDTRRQEEVHNWSASEEQRFLGWNAAPHFIEELSKMMNESWSGFTLTMTMREGSMVVKLRRTKTQRLSSDIRGKIVGTLLTAFLPC